MRLSLRAPGGAVLAARAGPECPACLGQGWRNQV